MNKTQKSFVKGAAILGGLGVIAKVLGAVYTIVTTHIVGPNGMADYQTAFPIYTFLLAISSAGLPVAISKMVSERVTLYDYKAARMVFRTAIKAMVFIGLITTVLMLCLSNQIAVLSKRADATYALLAIAPSLFFVSVISAYRGYFQGLQNMTPTAVSQIIEQLIKMFAGLALAYLWAPKGPEYGAAGAVLGITISEIAAFLYMLLLYQRRKKDIEYKVAHSVRSNRRTRLGRQLFYLAFPIIIGACALPFVQMLDTFIIGNTLYGMKSIVLFGKDFLVSKDVVDKLFGLTSYVTPIVNMPAVFSMALAMSLVPAISASKVKNDNLGVAHKSTMGIKLSMLIALPCAAGLYFLATPIIHLLYGLQDFNPADKIPLPLLSTAGNLLAIMGIGVLFLTVLQTMTGILQGLGKTYLPVINLFIGVAVKIIVSIVFIRIPEVNISGAFIGTAACYTVAAVLDVACVIKYTGAKIKIVNNFIKPMLATVAMNAVIYLIMPFGRQLQASGLLTVATICIAILVYGIFVILLGALTREDMAYIPGGRKLARLMIKLRLWKEKA